MNYWPFLHISTVLSSILIRHFLLVICHLVVDDIWHKWSISCDTFSLFQWLFPPRKPHHRISDIQIQMRKRSMDWMSSVLVWLLLCLDRFVVGHVYNEILILHIIICNINPFSYFVTSFKQCLQNRNPWWIYCTNNIWNIFYANDDCLKWISQYQAVLTTLIITITC